MRSATRDNFFRYTEPLEGFVTTRHRGLGGPIGSDDELVCTHYADVKSLITSVIGNLLDPFGASLSLPWRHRDGRLATQAEIRADWQRVKDGACKVICERKDCPLFKAGKKCHAHDGWTSSDIPTALRLTRRDGIVLFLREADRMWGLISARWPSLIAAPVAAQLLGLSWAWALGPHRQGYPTFDAAMARGDWRVAGKESTMSTKNNRGVDERNKHQIALGEEAALVEELGLDPNVLHWPNAVGFTKPTYTLVVPDGK